MSQFSPGVTQSLAAPAVAPAPVLTPGARRAAQYLQSIGNAAAQSLLTLGNQAEAERARAAAEDKETERRHETLFRGEGALTAGQEQAAWLEKIEKGEIIAADTPELNAELARQLVSQRASQFPVPVMGEEYRDKTLVWLTKTLESKRLEKADQERQRLDMESSAGFVAVTDAQRFADGFEYRKTVLRMNDGENYQGFINALTVNARSGNEAAVKAISDWLPDIYQLEKIEAQNIVRKVVLDQQMEISRQLTSDTAADEISVRGGQLSLEAAMDRARVRWKDDPEQLAAWLERLEDHAQEWRNERMIEADRVRTETENNAVNHIARHINDGQPEIAEKLIDRYRGQGVIDEARATGLLDRARGDIEERELKALRRQALIEEQAIRGDYSAQVRAMLDQGQAPLVQDFEITIDDGSLDGRTIKISRDDAIEEATHSAMQSIASETPDDPAMTLKRQTLWLGANRLTYKPYANTMKAGASAAVFDFVSRKPGDEFKVGSNAEKGFDLYLQMKVLNPITTLDHLDAESKSIYELAETSLLYGPNPGDRNVALATAARIIADPEFSEQRASLVRLDDIRKEITDRNLQWGFDDVVNRDDIAILATGRAKFFARAGAPPEEAVKMAIDGLTSEYKVINGWMIPVHRTRLPAEKIQQAGDLAANFYYRFRSASLQEQGLDSRDITLSPIDRNSWWIINGATGLPVADWNTAGFFTNEQLLKMIEEDDRKNASKAAAAQNRRRESLSNSPSFRGMRGRR